MLRQLLLSRRGARTLTIPRRNVIASGLRLRSLALRSTSKPRFSGSQHVLFSASPPRLSTISGELGCGSPWVRTFTSGPAPGNQTGEKSVSQKTNKEQHPGPLSKWTKAEVQDWLEKLKVDEELKFDVASVAASGHLFAQFTEAQLKEMADGPVGIHIFISKEELLAREKEAQTGFWDWTRLDKPLNRPFWLVAVLAFLGGTAYEVYEWYFDEQDRAVRALQASTVKSVLPDSQYVERKDVEEALAAVVGQPTTSYTVVVGPRGCGKSSVVRRVVQNAPGCVRVQVHTASQAQTLLPLILQAADVPDSLAESIHTVDQMSPLLSSAAEPQRVPTIIIEVGRGIADYTIHSIARDAKDIAETGTASVILVLSDASAAFALPEDPDRQNIIWVDDFSVEQARECLDNQHFLVGDESRRQKLFSVFGTRPAALAAAVGHEPDLDEYLRKRVETAKRDLRGMFAAETFLDVNPPLSGADFRHLVSALLSAKDNIRAVKSLGGSLRNFKAVTLAMKQQTSSHVLLYHMPTDTYRFFSQPHLLAAQELSEAGELEDADTANVGDK